MRIGVMGLAAATLIAPAAAMAQDAPANLTLTCNGTDSVPVAIAPNAWSSRYAYAMGGVVQNRQAAQLGVIVEGGKVRVRPPKSSIPLFAKDDQDGWFELTDVSIDRLSIRGRVKWNRLDRSKLNIDRRTGAADFGAFSGVCQLVSTTPEATKF
ncbi:hypothetical protein [Phenylobacterium sp.]|uniref:hypothetical protein n=1 Tax=Phenylobacterium sp. TaxID=1871053 RepID=UPI00121BE39D|nr:hypothetical protein [Phenylobacterium sp.]TAL32498.1 MAG: hypothetical protein EPN98_13085 [Phenylobacterium sp.]